MLDHEGYELGYRVYEVTCMTQSVCAQWVFEDSDEVTKRPIQLRSAERMVKRLRAQDVASGGYIRQHEIVCVGRWEAFCARHGLKVVGE